MFIDFNSTTVRELTFSASGTIPIGDANDLMTPEIMENLFSNLDADIRRRTFVKTEDVAYEVDEPEEEELDAEYNDADNSPGSEPDEYALMALKYGGEDWESDPDVLGAYFELELGLTEEEIEACLEVADSDDEQSFDPHGYGDFEEVSDDLDEKLEELSQAFRPKVRDTIRMNLRKLRDLIMNGKCCRTIPGQRSWKDSTRRPRPFRSVNGQVR